MVNILANPYKFYENPNNKNNWNINENIIYILKTVVSLMYYSIKNYHQTKCQIINSKNQPKNKEFELLLAKDKLILNLFLKQNMRDKDDIISGIFD